jgi:uncharacterized protein (TIGR02246 family)
MTPNRIREQIKKAALFWQTGDADGFASLFTLDGEFIAPERQWFGKTAIRDAVAQFAQENCHVKVHIRRILVDGDVAVIEWSQENTEKMTGICQQTEDSIIVDFRNGQISRWREYLSLYN